MGLLYVFPFGIFMTKERFLLSVEFPPYVDITLHRGQYALFFDSS